MGSEYKDVSAKGMAAYRAPSLLQPHKARQALRDAHEGKISPLIGYYCGIPAVSTARVMAQLGADFVWVDWEHASCGVETMTTIVHEIQHISEGKTMAFVRIPGHDHASIGYALDAGASIIVPQVETVEQAEHIVSAAKFGLAQKGTRSAPPARWLPGLGDKTIDPTRSVFESVNDQAALVIQIESEKGIKNLDAILTAVGDRIDCVWIGTLDLRVSMGLSGFWGPEPEFLNAVQLYEETLKKHDKPNSGMCAAGNWASGANKSLVITTGDLFAFLGQTGVLQEARDNLKPTDKRQKRT
ncbi:uncharacterized protein K452DRAFT_305344 [Aplosporella prunicola CBS 121167]|uniref:HpcH/HpaI aldolase/citrate lyase domain-containing protein n=1 Tax=Aplosporella prunicola CBS 121167 TaxID=1176127 RepID=A0A6A6BQX5_9PEZI|nr:uncharacterized protein K452DRAFT_305344 [Aplosporella prunicola CBS 121167]KAF2146410.1 hypothetical protein K452DRAFT_305344 [Aplosporella prunicola CBS 121167]